MRTKQWIGMFLAILILLPWAVMAAPVGKITNLQGNVDITVAGKAARIAVVGGAIQVGDIIRTKSKSRAEITFDGGNVMMLGENTRVGITQYMSGPDRNSSLFNLFRGKIQNIVKSVGAAGGRYEVHTPTSVCGVRGTTFFNFYLNGTSGSIFQEGSGYGYSKKYPEDVKTITAEHGMFVSGAAPGAQVRNVSDKQLDDMKNATEISESSGSSGGTGSSSDTGASGGASSSTLIGDAGVMGDTAGPGDNVPPPPPPMPSPYTPPPVVVPPTPVEQSLRLTIIPRRDLFKHSIDEGGTITGTSSDGGRTFSLSAFGGKPSQSGPQYSDPAGSEISGNIVSGSAVTGVSGFMMGLPNLQRTGAKALLSAIYIDSNGQAGFLTTPDPMTATFHNDYSFSGTGIAERGPVIASTGGRTISDIEFKKDGPGIGNVTLSQNTITFGCDNEKCDSGSNKLDVSGGRVIGVWAGYGTGTFQPNGTEGVFGNKMVVSYDPDGQQIFFSDKVSGSVDTTAKEVRLSGTFLYMDENYKGTITLNHVGYYDGSDYTSISTGTIQATATNLISQDLNNSIWSSASGLDLNSLRTDQLNNADYVVGMGITTMSGSRGDNPSVNLACEYYYNLADGSEGREIIDSKQNGGIDGNGNAYGDIVGAGANWTTAKTYVLGGEIKGDFNPSNTGTWNATALSTRIETATFMALAATPEGRSKLEALNIPSVQVGTVSLSGQGNGWQSLKINNMGFYASSSGGTPQIWASNDVQGTLLTANIQPTGTVNLKDNNNVFNADFTIRSFKNNKWGAEITGGSGSLNDRDVFFQGGAAGTYTGTSVTGTASGTAKGGNAFVADHP